MKFSFHLITTLVSVALCGIVHAAPAPLCDRTNGLCADIAARDVADSMMGDDLVARAAPKKAANAKIQRQAAPKVERKVKAFQKQANKGSASPAKVNAQANKLRQSEKGRVATQARKDNKAAKKQAWAGAASRATTTKNIQAVQKKQGQKPMKKAAKKDANNKIQQKAAASIKQKVQDYRAKEKAAGGYMPRVNILADRMRGKEKERALTQARKDRKIERAKQWVSKKDTPEAKATKQAAADRRKERQRTGAPSPPNKAKDPKNVKPTKQEKKNVKDRFQAARQKYSQTQGMPARGQTATVGTNSANGREVRNSVFNSYLHQKNPIGTQRLPKPFNNDPYSPTHGTLANQRPLPQTARKLKEYPVIKNSPNGWTGNGQVGALRTITYKNGGQRHAAVIGHDTSPARGGDERDHYVATVTRDLESSDMEDFE